MSRNQIRVFFYGLFMDESLLASKGIGVQESTIGYLDGQTALPIPVFQRPCSNALETARSIDNLLA